MSPVEKHETIERFNLRRFFPYRFSILEQRLSKAIAQKYMTDFGLSRVEWRVMASLAEFEKTSAREICEFTHLEKMQVSRAISSFKRSSIVLQKKNNDDQRLTELSLTKKGWKIYRKIIPLVKAQEQNILSVLSETEQKQLHKILNKLEQALD